MDAIRRIVAAFALTALMATAALVVRPGAAGWNTDPAVLRVPQSATPWTVLWENDGDTGGSYYQCPIQPGMGENDIWTFVAEGALAGSFEVSNPRPTCMGMVARAAFRWTGKGRPPTVSLEIVDPTGVTSPNAYSVTRIVATKQGRPTWVQLCFENQSTPYWGTYRFRVTGDAAVRFGANVMPHETDIQGCDWWPSQLGSWGL